MTLLQAVVIKIDEAKGITLSTKVLEAEPGDVLTKRQEVWEAAEQRAEQFRESMGLTGRSSWPVKGVW